MPRSVSGKSAIVTGAGAGINFSFAKLLLEKGASVLIADLSLRPEGQALLDEYKDSPKAVFQRTDVSSWSDLTAMFKRAEREFGTIDIVCPGAGVFEPEWSSFWFPPGTPGSKDDPAGDRYRSLDINLIHPIRATQLAISHFLRSPIPPSEKNWKAVVHIISTAGEGASLMFPLYHATKWGLRGFVASMAPMEKEFSIRVAGVAPGLVKTPLWTESVDKMAFVTKDGQVMPDSAWITPEYCAEQMLALLTEDELTGPKGEKIQVQGGLMLEVGAKHVREVPVYGNIRPDHTELTGLSTTNAAAKYYEVIENIKKPGWGYPGEATTTGE